MSSNGNRVQVWRSLNDNLWYFHFQAANNEIITRSTDGYHNPEDAIDGARLAHPGTPIYTIQNVPSLHSKDASVVSEDAGDHAPADVTDPADGFA